MSKHIKIDSKLINKSELARKLGVTPQYIGQVLSGKRPGKKIKERINKYIYESLKAA